jgi:hypothetical protein
MRLYFCSVETDNNNRVGTASLGGGIMKLKWHNIELDYNDATESVTIIQDQIQNWVSSNGVASYFLCVDDTNIYSDCKSYVQDHIGEISTIEVITQSVQEFSERLTISISEYLSRAIPQLKQLYRELYQQASTDSWDRLSDLFEGMQWLHEAVGMFPADIGALGESVIDFRSKIDEIASEFINVVENQDAITIADLIQYEVNPAYVDLQKGIEAILNNKVVMPDVN